MPTAASAAAPISAPITPATSGERVFARAAGSSSRSRGIACCRAARSARRESGATVVITGPRAVESEKLTGAAAAHSADAASNAVWFRHS